MSRAEGAGGLGWRSVAAPWTVAKALGLLVPLLVTWQTSSASGLPGRAEFRQAFDWWDAQSYLHIAQSGYPTDIHDHFAYLFAFLPGYPLLVAGLGWVLGDLLVAGLAVNLVLEYVALLLVARLVAAESDPAGGRFAAWLLAMWPFAFFLTAIYTESAFIAASAGALLLARRGHLGRAALCAGLACSVRITGLALVPMLAVEYVRRRGWRPHWQLATIVAVPLPLVGYALYTHAQAGDAWAFLHAQSLFDHSLDWPWKGARVTWDQVVLTRQPAYNSIQFLVELVFGVAGLLAVLIGLFSPRMPLSFSVYCAAVWVTATSVSFWRSVPRYELAMFPLLIVAAEQTRDRPAVRAALVTAGAGLMAYGAGRFALDGWLG